jgi:hypothetical protein
MEGAEDASRADGGSGEFGWNVCGDDGEPDNTDVDHHAVCLGRLEFVSRVRPKAQVG